MFVRCECCVLSGRGLCEELITRPEESYRLRCVVVCDLETTKILVNEEEAKAHWGAIAPREKLCKNCRRYCGNTVDGRTLNCVSMNSTWFRYNTSINCYNV